MRFSFRLLAVALVATTASLVISADDKSYGPKTYAPDVQLQAGDTFFAEGLYNESLAAYKAALASEYSQTIRRARAGLIQSALRVAEFDLARKEAATLFLAEPKNPEAISLYGDSLWAAGLFEAAEGKFREALAINPDLARGHHGLAKALTARGRLDDAMAEAQLGLKGEPRDLEMHHTVGTIYERMHKYEEAAAAFGNYVNLLPNKDKSDKAAWSRAEIKFLKSFDGKPALAIDTGAENLHTVEFRVVNEKVVIRAKVNGGSLQDFIVDTGSESTVVSRQTASRLGIRPVTYTLSAGVGEVGLRGLQLARIDTLEIGGLKLKNVPCIIKNPPLRDIPTRETESLSPLALGLSMVIDYQTHQITMGRHLPDEARDVEMPLRMYRLATVQGTVGKDLQAPFVVDTGGEVISISQATATALNPPPTTRKIPVKVYGTSGWDRDAFLMPGVDLSFAESVAYNNYPVIVLNLDAPSALLGFQVGGIVGHKFLSKYRVGLDLERSVMRLKRLPTPPRL